MNQSVKDRIGGAIVLVLTITFFAIGVNTQDKHPQVSHVFALLGVVGVCMCGALLGHGFDVAAWREEQEALARGENDDEEDNGNGPHDPNAGPFV